MVPIGIKGQVPSSFDTTGLSKYIELIAKIGQVPDVAVAVIGKEILRQHQN
jgi:hypothetical protein